jgi:cellulose synthase/poly-beta-1,6-N-acetylglucosamine synthase-like glycosyltransferase
LPGTIGTQFIWSQSSVNVSSTDISPESMTSKINELLERMDLLIKQSEASPRDEVSDIQSVYLSIIVFMMGLSFVILGLYIFQEQKLSIFTKRLFLISHLSLMTPVTIILLYYLIKKVLIGESDTLMLLTSILLIPVVMSYILMVVKYRRIYPEG